ncbi:Homoserine/homoserine lactone efflux protein [Phaeobacter sp. CECT 5382]|uniref:LysE family translocator n=1 Tax=Rhodobacterales TaxID=204455 RepID=UPI0006DBC274|nr:LysE family translocator [Phaeobacter sp. CECT 5382]CUH87632.1 Homoserine/homoserine lactone efflux protein [Phaeobacter sp. CECT 5382]
MDFNLWLAFVAASTALLLIPGPTVLLVLSYALSKGRSVAVASALGVALGDLIAMSASLAGLGALVMASAALFSVLKWLGAAYLLWLGIKLWRSAADAQGLTGLVPTDGIKARGVFSHAAVVTALNPKSIAFFIAFVPQFIRPTESLAPQFAILIATFVGLAAINALAYALLADRLRSWIARPRAIANLTRTGGAALVGMGIATAFLRRPG